MGSSILFFVGFVVGYFLPKILIENSMYFKKSTVMLITILVGLILSTIYVYLNSKDFYIGNSITEALGTAFAMNLLGNISFAITFYNSYKPVIADSKSDSTICKEEENSINATSTIQEKNIEGD